MSFRHSARPGFPGLATIRSLLHQATPGPWDANLLGSVRADRVPLPRDAARGRMSIEAAAGAARRSAQADIQLAALAPVLAQKVLDQAQRLAVVERWARSLCEATCGQWQAAGQYHVPNCPVADLGLGDELRFSETRDNRDKSTEGIDNA